MKKITNKTPHPYDIHTKDGVKVIAAFGTLEAEFDPAYLEMIKLSFDFEEVAEDREVDKIEEPESSEDDDQIDSEDQAEDTEPEDESDSHNEQTEQDNSEAEDETEEDLQAEEEEEEQVEQEETEEQPLDPKFEYEELAGKKPDGRWSEERVLAEIAKLKG